MTGLRYRAIGAAFDLLSLPGIARIVRTLSATRGHIFTCHRVLPGAPAAFAPNAILQITPDFLEAVITGMRRLGFEWVSLDEALARLELGREAKPFAVLTFDDAYRDNLHHALPVLKKHACPFTLYVPTAFVDGKGEVWWQAIEDLIAGQARLQVDGQLLPVTTLADKQASYERLYWQMRDMPEEERVRLIHRLAGENGMSLHEHCRKLIMDWDELAAFVAEPLCTIGAHTVHHYELSKLPPEAVRAEIAGSIEILRERTGVQPVHISFPIGSSKAAGEREYRIAKDLRVKSAVTTIPGGLYEEHAGFPYALPRISLNGLYQKKRYVGVFASGAVFSAMGGKAA